MNHNLRPDRVRVLFALRRVHVSKIAALLGVSTTYIHQQIDGTKRLTPDLAAVLRGVIGPEAWAWACGETDVLVTPEAAHE